MATRFSNYIENNFYSEDEKDFSNDPIISDEIDFQEISEKDIDMMVALFDDVSSISDLQMEYYGEKWMRLFLMLRNVHKKKIMSLIVDRITHAEEEKKHAMMQLIFNVISENYRRMDQDAQMHFKREAAILITAPSNMEYFHEKAKTLEVRRSPSLPSTKFVLETANGLCKGTSVEHTAPIVAISLIKYLCPEIGNMLGGSRVK